jgi:hypothetical protein
VIVDRAWIARNIGVDPATVSIPKSAFAARAAATRDASLDDIQRDIIDFDSEGPEGSAFLAFTKATGLSRFVDIPWPKGLAPRPRPRAPQLAVPRRSRAPMFSSSHGQWMRATRSVAC